MTNLELSIIKHEGYRPFVYKCPAGKLTIGYGRNLEDSGLSQDECLYLLKNDITKIRIQCNREFSWFIDMNQERQDVIVEMIYNLGFTGFLKFKRMLAFLPLGEYESAAKEMLDSVWANQVKTRANELSKQLATGVYINVV